MNFDYFFKSYFDTNKSLIILDKTVIFKYSMYRAFRWCKFLADLIILNMFKLASNTVLAKKSYGESIG